MFSHYDIDLHTMLVHVTYVKFGCDQSCLEASERERERERDQRSRVYYIDNYKLGK